MKDIFDLDDISDCPEDLQEAIRPRRQYRENTQYKYVYALFLKKHTLTLDELQVGFYREYGTFVSRYSLVGSINLLRNKGSIINVRQGVYRRIGANMGAKK